MFLQTFIKKQKKCFTSIVHVVVVVRVVVVVVVVDQSGYIT